MESEIRVWREGDKGKWVEKKGSSERDDPFRRAWPNCSEIWTVLLHKACDFWKSGSINPNFFRPHTTVSTDCHHLHLDQLS